MFLLSFPVKAHLWIRLPSNKYARERGRCESETELGGKYLMGRFVFVYLPQRLRDERNLMIINNRHPHQLGWERKWWQPPSGGGGPAVASPSEQNHGKRFPIPQRRAGRVQSRDLPLQKQLASPSMKTFCPPTNSEYI